MTRSAQGYANRPIRRALWFLVIAIAGIRSTSALAGQDAPSSGGQDLSTHLVETPYMKLGIHAAPWLPQAIADMQAKQRPPLDIDTVALFDDKAASRYLIIVWDRRRADPDNGEHNVADFIRVLEGSDGHVQLQPVSRDSDYVIELEPPSGMAAFPGEPPIAVLGHESGGSNLTESWIVVLEMGSKIVDIGPKLGGIQRLTDVDDVNGDGKNELLARNDGWAGYFSTASTAGPEIRVIFDRANGKFEPACQNYRPAYRSWIANDLESGANPKMIPSDRAEFYASALLNAAQIGDIADARRILEKLMAVVDMFDPWPSWIPSTAAVRQDFNALLKKAESVADKPCAVNATGIEQGGYNSINEGQYSAGGK